mgnify:FL=1
MEKRRIYFKEWRKHRDLTQKQVVDRLSMHDDELLPKTEASLSRLENRKQQYSERVLEALADVYECEPEDLLGRDPKKEGKVIDMFRRFGEERLRQAMAILDALEQADGTNG